MKKNLNQNLGRRILSLVMVLLMAIPWVSAPALAAPNWSDLSISVSWTDGSGNQQSATANTLSWTKDPSFWVQVNSDAPFSSVTLSFSFPGHEDYQYDAGQGFGNLTLTNVKNAGGLDTNNAVWINVVDGSGNPVTTSAILLYISTSVQPEEPQATEKPPVQKEIDIVYQGNDGANLGGTKFTAVEGQENPVQAPPTIEKDGKTYTLTGDAVQKVTVNANGEASPSPVTFFYDPPRQPAQKEIDVVYQGSDGANLGGTKFTAVEGQENPVQAPPTIDKDGKTYTLTGDAVQKVTVNANGEASPSPVTFFYDPPRQPAQKEVEVIYKGSDEVVLGGTKITATESQDNPATAPGTIEKDGKTYTLSGDAVQNVTVNANGEASPDPVIFIYNPPAKQPAQKEVEVIYKGSDEAVLGGTKITATEGQDNSATAPGTLEKDGKTYTLSGDAVQKVTVNANGEASPDPVIFIYNPPAKQPAQKEVDVIYKGSDDAALGGTKITAKENQENSVTAPGTLEKDGKTYTLSGNASQNVTVNANGEASPDPVIFIYNPPAQAAKFPVQIEYVKDGQVFHTSSQDITAGQSAPVPVDENQTPVGYKLQGDASVNVSMDAQGNPTPAKVTFTYVVKQETTVSGKVTTEYIKDNAVFFTEDVYVNTPGGPVPARTEKTPEGYKLEGDASVNVTVDANGTATPNKVTFKYVPVQITPVTAKVTVEYIKDNAVFHSEEVTVKAPGEPVYADINQTPAGYKPEGESSVNVTVDANGTAAPNKVTFKYIPVQVTPATAQVTVNYSKDGTVFFTEPVTVSAPGGPVTARNDKTPAEYKLEGAASVNVLVNDQGVASPNTVTFNYVSNVKENIPVGNPIDRWGVTNDKVNFRSSPTTTGNNRIKELPLGTHVWMFESFDKDNKVWTHVKVDGQEGYIVTQYIDMMTQAQSDGYQSTLPSPMPTRSPAPTTQPTTAPQYTGYALTTKQVALRTDANNADQNILATLPANTLVHVTNQVNQGTVPWSMVETLDGLIGYVPDDSLRRINQEEAKYYIDQYNAAHPTAAPVTPTPSPSPVQQHGYAATLGDNVPMRGAADPNSMLVNMLAKNTVVYVSGQDYLSGTAWHIVQYKGQWGYIRADQLRWLSQQETEAYLKSLNTPTPTPANTLPPLDQNSPSSYGYVTNDGVNFRSTPGGTKIGTLNKYAFALVLGSTQADGKTWYKVNQAGKEGYISGDFFKVLSLAGLEEFLQSPEYAQGTTGNTGNNNNNNNSNNNNSEPPTSPEDMNVGTWTNPNTGLNATYEPFDPYSTPEPLPTPTASPTPEPLATFEPLPTEPPVQTQSDNPSLGWLVGVGVVLLGGFGGLYAYALHKSNQRKAAARAAQRRAAMQQNPQGGARPYARATNAPMVPPASGTQTRPAAPPTGAPRPQTPGSTNSPYSQRPANAQPSGTAQRPPVTRPGQPGSTQSAMPGQQPSAFARPTAGTQQGTQSAASYRPEAQGNSAPGGQAGTAQQSGASAGTSRQTRAARHAADQNKPTDTNENL